jgi:hypothetical protein
MTLKNIRSYSLASRTFRRGRFQCAANNILLGYEAKWRLCVTTFFKKNILVSPIKKRKLFCENR